MSAVRDMAQDMFDRFAGFIRGHSTSSRARPGVGIGFIIAAVVVLLLGMKWFTSDGASGSTDDGSWALDPLGSGGTTTTIATSPEAVAVRVGTAVPHGATPTGIDPVTGKSEKPKSVTVGIPGTSIAVEIPLSPTTTGPGSGGGGGGGGGGGHTTTTRGGSPPTDPTTTQTPPTDPTTTETPPTDPTTTETPPTDPTTTEDTTPPTSDTTAPETLGLDITVDLGPTTSDPGPTDTSPPPDSGGGVVGDLVGDVVGLLS
jgi:hypothetical protein